MRVWRVRVNGGMVKDEGPHQPVQLRTTKQDFQPGAARIDLDAFAFSHRPSVRTPLCHHGHLSESSTLRPSTLPTIGIAGRIFRKRSASGRTNPHTPSGRGCRVTRIAESALRLAIPGARNPSGVSVTVVVVQDPYGVLDEEVPCHLPHPAGTKVPPPPPPPRRRLRAVHQAAVRHRC